MDFDHRDPTTKDFEVGSGIRAYSLERCLEEMAKCDVVCAVCHRIRTHLGREEAALVKWMTQDHGIFHVSSSDSQSWP